MGSSQVYHTTIYLDNSKADGGNLEYSKEADLKGLSEMQDPSQLSQTQHYQINDVQLEKKKGLKIRGEKRIREKAKKKIFALLLIKTY
jgi:hypothetical protein